VEAFSYPVLGRESGEQYGRIWMFHDITEAKRYSHMLENLSSTDGLTGIWNRRRFDEFMEREWRRSARDGSELSLLIVDIDYFKLFNDRYGHLAGDDCLKQVAAALKETVTRATDLVARYGGEEFTCVLPATPQEGAVTVALNALDKVAGLRILHDSSPAAPHVTVSIGVATAVPERGGDYSSLIETADRHLYAAKLDGRNRVMAAAGCFRPERGR
jgi:diguanylate cyclase (GGDEF)-like protein